MMSNRKHDLVSFYELLDSLNRKTGGPFLLADCGSQLKWPQRGVYFFMEPGELRTDTGLGHRVVRVGTHALKLGSRSTLWQRLSQHKGAASSLGGNHRGSIFRLLVGTTFLNESAVCQTWGQGSTAKGNIRIHEASIEHEVSSTIRSMPFLYLSIDDDATPNSLRGYIERNSIALLSNYERAQLDVPSSTWRGLRCDREKVRISGLWNQNHVNENYDPAFLQSLETLIDKMKNKP